MNPADPRPSGSAGGGRRPLLVLAGLSAFGPLTTDVYLPGFPGMAADLHASAAAAQLTLTACVIGLALGQLFIGPLSDMTGRRLPLLSCLGVFTAASLGCAAAPSLPLLIAGRFLQGASGAGGVVVARAVVRDVFAGDEAARAYSNLSAIVTSGPIFAPLLGALILLFSDWRGIFVGLAVIGVLLAIAVHRVIAETLPIADRKAHAVSDTLRNVVVLLRHRRYLAYVLSGAFGFGTMFAYISASSFVYQDVFGTSAQLYSVLIAINGLALMSSNVVNGRLVARVGQERLLRRGLGGLLGGSSAIAIAAIAGAGPAAILPLLLLTVGCVGFVISNSVALAMAGEPARAGAASALFGLFQFSVGAAVAPLVGIAGSSAIPMGVAMAGSAAVAFLSYRLLGRSAPA
ncbi:MAG: multidrug effflux MFS transporter [Solirubrobacterales bacterium]